MSLIQEQTHASPPLSENQWQSSVTRGGEESIYVQHWLFMSQHLQRCVWTKTNLNYLRAPVQTLQVSTIVCKNRNQNLNNVDNRPELRNVESQLTLQSQSQSQLTQSDVFNSIQVLIALNRTFLRPFIVVVVAYSELPPHLNIWISVEQNQSKSYRPDLKFELISVLRNEKVVW